VGVAPEDYGGTFRGIVPSVIAPTMMVNELDPGEESALENRGSHSVFVKARLRPGVTMAHAQTAVDGVAAEQHAQSRAQGYYGQYDKDDRISHKKSPYSRKLP